MKRSAQAIWNGGGKNGKGTLTTDSKALSAAQYSFATRFENGVGTNPEELVAAAHAGCFSMALSFALEKSGFAPEQISTRAEVNIENLGAEGWGVTTVHLSTEAKVPGIDPNKFEEIAESAKANCPISKLLKAKITLSARLERSQAA